MISGDKWAEIDALEDQAQGIFVGGLLVDAGIDVLSAWSGPVAEAGRESAEVRAILIEMGAKPRAT
jgi:hypothetical protein